MTTEHVRIFRDPLYGNIRLLPFEVLIIDLKIFQRLRYLKQTPSVSYVFNSANHTRFEHSIGSLYIAELYGRNLNLTPLKKELLRLSALLHDVGHGIFSHQYDATIYKEIYPQEKHGHDEHRRKIISEYIPKALMEVYKKRELKKSIKSSGLKEYVTGRTDDTIDSIMKKIVEILSKEGEIYYNIIHGPFGCDRMDFLKRDSFFSGTPHYGGFPLDRFILFSLIKENENNEILCYSSKILDDIILFLFNRFHMFKNVYFHKTCRALDLMLQQVLKEAKDPLNLVERTKDLNEFENLNDLAFFPEIQNQSKGDNQLTEAIKLVDRIYKRDFYKTVVDQAVLLTGETLRTTGLYPPEILKMSAEKTKSHIERQYEENEDGGLPQLFIDTPFEIKMSPLQELEKARIDIYDEKTGILRKYRDIENERNFKTIELKSFNIYRIYTTSKDEREKLKLYIPEITENIELEVDTRI